MEVEKKQGRECRIVSNNTCFHEGRYGLFHKCVTLDVWRPWTGLT